jgi:hypothetical protein
LDQKARSNDVLSTRNTPQKHKYTHTQTKSERLEKDLLGMQKLKVIRSSYSWSSFCTKISQKRKRRLLHTNEGKNQQENTTILNIYTPNIGALKFVHTSELQGKIGPVTIIVRDLNTALSSRQKNYKDILELNNTMDEMDIYSVSLLIAGDYTFFLSITWNFLQNRSHPRYQSKPQQIQKSK